MQEYQDAITAAVVYADREHSGASIQHKYSFAYSVAYLASGITGGGPSMRQHLVSWSLGTVQPVNFNGMTVSMVIPNPALPVAGGWRIEEAIAHCVPLCFEPAANHLDKLLRIIEMENCFDDDPADKEAVRAKTTPCL